jgi:hypothetical protein
VFAIAWIEASVVGRAAAAKSLRAISRRNRPGLQATFEDAAASQGDIRSLIVWKFSQHRWVKVTNAIGTDIACVEDEARSPGLEMSLYHPRDDMFHPPEFPKPDSDGKKALIDLPDVDCRPGIIAVDFDPDHQTWTIPVRQLGSIVIRVAPDIADESNELVVASLRP